MNLTFLALLWAAAAGAISLVSVRLFLGRLISRSCAFVFVPMAVISVLLPYYYSPAEGTSLIVNTLYLLLLPLASSLIMILICLKGLSKKGIEEESFWKNVNILSLIVIVIFRELNFAVEHWNQFLYRGFVDLPPASSAFDGGSILKTIVLAESYGWVFLALSLPCFLWAFYFSPRTEGDLFLWWFVISGTSIISMALFVTGGLFSVALIITVPWLVAREGLRLGELHVRVLLAGVLFGLSAFAFNLISGIPSAIGGAFIVFFILASSGRKVTE